MKRISQWAKAHVVITRIIIVFIHALLILTAFYLTNVTEFDFSISVLAMISLVLIGASLLYPFAKRHSYRLQKITLFITSSCFFLITCFFFRHNFQLPYFQQTLSAVSLPADTLNKISTDEKIQSLPYMEKRGLTRTQKRLLKKELRKEIKAYKKLPKAQRPTGQDALLIFLIVLSGIGLLFCLSILVCGISCGGIPAIAIILTLLGAGGIGVGLYFIIRKLTKNIDKERNKSDNTPDSSYIFSKVLSYA